MVNPITEFTANQFLLFYGVLIVATLIFCKWQSHVSDPATSTPVPAVPDPYETAYLRGGQEELVKTVIAGLMRRGYLSGNSEERTVQQASGHPGLKKLSPLERSIFERFSAPLEPEEIELHSSESFSYEEKLQREQLLTSDEMQAKAWWIRFIGMAAVGGIGAMRALVGLNRNRPIGFLIIMGTLGCIVIWNYCRAPRLTSGGQRYLAEIKKSLGGLEVSPDRITTVSDFLLLVGAFGLAPLATTEYSYYKELLSKRVNTASGYGGGCSGGGCGGGCGGCGGCG